MGHGRREREVGEGERQRECEQRRGSQERKKNKIEGWGSRELKCQGCGRMRGWVKEAQELEELRVGVG